MIDNSDKVLIAQRFVDLVKAKRKASIDEISHILGIAHEKVLEVANTLIKNKIFGVEYKFTTPYFYINRNMEDFRLDKIGLFEAEEKNLEQKSGDMPGDMPHSSANPASEIEELIDLLSASLKEKKFAKIADAYKNLLIKLPLIQDLRRARYMVEVSLIKKELQKEMEGCFDFNAAEKIINSLIERCNYHLTNGNVAEAKKVYEEASVVHRNIPDDYFEQKSLLGDRLMELYKQINTSLLRLLSSKALEVSKHIEELISNAKIYISQNNFNGAADIYKRCVDIIDKVPQSFLKQRLELYNELFNLYKQINIKADIKRLQYEDKE